LEVINPINPLKSARKLFSRKCKTYLLPNF